MNIKIIIAGGRDFYDLPLLIKTLDSVLFAVDIKEVEIVSGCANGADRSGEIYAKNNKIPIKSFPANWDKYNKQAGYIRNFEMAEYATHCIVFWDGISKGSKHMIDSAKANNLKLMVIKYNNFSGENNE